MLLMVDAEHEDRYVYVGDAAGGPGRQMVYMPPDLPSWMRTSTTTAKAMPSHLRMPTFSFQRITPTAAGGQGVGGEGQGMKEEAQTRLRRELTVGRVDAGS